MLSMTNGMNKNKLSVENLLMNNSSNGDRWEVTLAKRSTFTMYSLQGNELINGGGGNHKYNTIINSFEHMKL